jgi:putative ABC transport system permease protein
MWRLSIRSALAHKRRLLSSVFSIVIGISFLCGTFVFSDSLRRTFDDLFGSVYANADSVVRSSQVVKTAAGESRGRLDDSIVAKVKAVPGVTDAVGSVGGYARIIDHAGKPMGADQGIPNFGMDITDTELSVWTRKAGRVPADGTEMAMDAGSYKKGKFALGDRVTVIGQAGSRTFTLVGVFGFGSVDSPVGARVALFDITTAQQFVGEEGKVDSVTARGDGTLTEAELTARIAKAMPSGTEVLTAQQMADDSASQIKKNLSFFNTLLLVFAFVALFVGSFIIYNTFSIVVAQRLRENALLRALGASRRQVLSALLVEALLMGVVGSVVGFVAGFGMAVVLRGMLSAVGIDIPSGGLVLLPRTVLVSMSVGIIITLLAAILPARRGARVPPVAAMRDVAVEQRAFSRARLASGLGLLVLAVVLVAVGFAGNLSVLGIGVAGVFIALFVLGPLIARPVAGTLGRPLRRMRGMAGMLARENAMRNPKRTARTAAALMVGVALVAGITVFASSIKASIRGIFADEFNGDLVVNSKSYGFGGLPITLAGELATVPGVQTATGIEVGVARIDGTDSMVMVVDPSTVGKVFDLEMQAGTIESLDESGVLISKKRADSDHLALGSSVRMVFLNGTEHVLKVAGIYRRDELTGPFTIAKQLYAKSGADQFDFSIFLTKRPGASDDAIVAGIQEVIASYPTASVQTRSNYIESQASSIDSFVNLVYGLLALAVVIAVFGIANTLSLSVHERTRELGLLRAVGATRRQIRSMVRWESVLTALLGAVQGIVVGVALGWATVHALRSQGFGVFHVPIVGLVVVLLVAVVCGVLAATRPARRAARLDILDAIASE